MSGQVNGMKEPQGNFLLVCLMAVFIIMAFVLAFTLVVTAIPLSDPGDTFRVNMAILRNNVGGGGGLCLVDDDISLQETCPKFNEAGVLFDAVKEH